MDTDDIFGVLFPDSAYPKGFLERFGREEKIFSSSEESCVCLVRDRNTGSLYSARYVFPVIRENGDARTEEELLQEAMRGSGAFRECSVLKTLDQNGSIKGIPSDPCWYPGDPLSISVHSFSEGITLEELSARGQLNRKEGPGNIFLNILTVVEGIHSHCPAAVHLDIKPENIIIGPDENITLIDFESALLLDKDGTAWGGSHGTRPYAAPQQFSPPYAVDRRTDIYALGVLLRYIYTGSAECRTDRLMPEKISRIVEKCTRPDPKDRYQTVKELKADFKKAVGKKTPKFIIPAAAALILILAVLLLFKAVNTRKPPAEMSEVPPETSETRPETAIPSPETSEAPSETEAPQTQDTVPAGETDAAGADIFYVYKDSEYPGNHFLQKMLMQSADGVYRCTIDENHEEYSRDDSDTGNTCIRCETVVDASGWCGFSFLNGVYDKDSGEVKLNEGLAPGQGIRLTGAKELRFLARGAEGGEKAEFFCCGFGYDGETDAVLVPYPDSSKKRSSGMLNLSAQWEEYSISLTDADLENISCGFGYVTEGAGTGTDQVFFLDEIRFIY